MTDAVVTLKKGEGRYLQKGGPWIYNNEIADISPGAEDGGLVRVCGENGWPLGQGFLNRRSKLTVRMLTRDPDAEINEDFFLMRLKNAWEYRKKVVDTSSCRLVFGEADFLPGLVVDKFSDVLVVESLALGIDRFKVTIVELLKELLAQDGIAIRGVYERSDAKVRLQEGMERYKGFLGAPFDTKVEIVENGVRYFVDVKDGQKTGFFLDQKYNRRAVARIAAGHTVLDCFTHTGSFALKAAAGGAARVTAADISDVLDDIDELTAAGQLFAPDAYADHAFDFKNRSNVVKALCLHVAHTCNLNCSYCFAAQGKFHGEAGLMSFETGKRALDFLIENSGTRRNLEVDFFGGEPLMNFEVCKQLVAYARSIEKKYNKNFRFTMTTNGIGITDEVIDWCNKECHNVVLSLDGRKEVNDRFRVDLAGNGSYDRIVPKFQKLVKARGGQGYYMRGTFTHHNVDFTKDLFHMADDLGFTELSMEPVVAPPDSPEALTEEDLPKLFDQYELLANDMLRRQKAGKPITFYHYILDLKHGPCIYKRISGCGSGTEYMAVTPWGDLYPCHQFVGDPAYKLGNVWDGVTNTALRDEFKLCNVYARPDCKDCWARLYCAGGCAANALHATGDIHGTYEYGCKVFRKRMECALMMQVAQRLDPELAKNAVRFESDCDGCGEGNDGACEK